MAVILSESRQPLRWGSDNRARCQRSPLSPPQNGAVGPPGGRLLCQPGGPSRGNQSHIWSLSGLRSEVVPRCGRPCAPPKSSPCSSLY